MISFFALTQKFQSLFLSPSSEMLSLLLNKLVSHRTKLPYISTGHHLMNMDSNKISPVVSDKTHFNTRKFTTGLCPLLSAVITIV